MKDLASYFNYRNKLNNAQMAFNPHLLTPKMLKEINLLLKNHNGQDFAKLIEDINNFQYKKLMDKHFKNLQAIARIQGKTLTSEEASFVDAFGLDNENLTSTTIYLPNGQVLKNSNDKNFIKTFLEEKSFILVNVSPYRVEIQVKDDKSNAKIKACNPIENRYKNPTITTEITRGNVKVINKNTFDNTYYDVCKADAKNINVLDFITEEKTVNNLNVESTEEMEKE